ncbi:MAG: hypothetical protein ACRDI0_00815 [Actinomycetota bacterium]
MLSWIFLGAAIGTLVYGLTQPGLTFIYVSIGASVVAMLFLLAGVLRKKPVQPATAGAPYGPPPEEAAARSAETTAVATRPAERREAATRPATPAQRKPAAARRRPSDELTRPAGAPAGEAAAEAPKPAGKKRTAAKKAAAKKATPKKATPKKAATTKAAAAKPTARTTARVVAIPERGTYHESGCRFVKGRTDTERLTKSTAKRRGYSACGVCKPG